MLDGNNDYLKIDNIKIFYKKYDNSSSDNVLVFLHGWGGDSSSWDFNIKELKNYFTCIVLDFPGFGISERPNKIWNVEDYTDFLQKFVEELNIKKFILVGKSFGGRVATKYASKYPEKLTNLILVSAAGIEMPSLLVKVKIFIAKIGKSFVKSFFPRYEMGIKGLFYNIFAIKEDESNYKWEVKKLVTNDNLSENAASIATPTLIVWGNEDKVLPINTAKKLNALIKHSVLEIIPGGHNAHKDYYNDFNRVMLKYLGIEHL